MEKQVYVSPQIEVLEIMPEMGFAASGDSSATIVDWESGNF